LKKKGLCSPDAGALFLPLDIPVTAGVPLYLACGVTDMRKGIAGLAALTQDV